MFITDRILQKCSAADWVDKIVIIDEVANHSMDLAWLGSFCSDVLPFHWAGWCSCVLDPFSFFEKKSLPALMCFLLLRRLAILYSRAPFFPFQEKGSPLCIGSFCFLL